MTTSPGTPGPGDGTPQQPYQQQPYQQQQSPYGYQYPVAPGQLPIRPQVSIGEAFRYAWQGFKLNPVPWILATLTMLVLGSIGQSIVANMRATREVFGWEYVGQTPGSWFVNLLFNLISFAIGAAMVQAALRLADGRRVDFNDLLNIPNFLQAMLAALLLSVATSIGVLLLVLPGIIIAVLGVWYLHVALDRNTSAVDALVGSVTLVTQNLGTTLLLGLAALGVVILGALALGVGLLVAIPLVVIASVFVFRRISGGPVMVPGSAPF